MECALDAYIRSQKVKLPVFIMPTVDRFLGCADWCYLNALAKYLSWSQLDYVGLDCSSASESYRDFPGLKLVKAYSPNPLNIAAGSVDGIYRILSNLDSDLHKVDDHLKNIKLDHPIANIDGVLF